MPYLTFSRAMSLSSGEWHSSFNKILSHGLSVFTQIPLGSKLLWIFKNRIMRHYLEDVSDNSSVSRNVISLENITGFISTEINL